jgi:SprT protein
MSRNQIITPISQQQQAEVIAATNRCIDRASVLYGRVFETLPINFDLQGRCAGMYQVRGSMRRIRFNPWLFAKYYQDSISDTVIHEVAHYIVDRLYGLKRVTPHGAEWKKIMLDLGAIPKATANYDLTGIPTRQYQRFAYSCGCRTHRLTAIRHRKIIEYGAKYLCQFCHGRLVAAPQETL